MGLDLGQEGGLCEERQRPIELRWLGDIGEEQRKGVLVNVFGQLVKDPFEMLRHLNLLFFKE